MFQQLFKVLSVQHLSRTTHDIFVRHSSRSISITRHRLRVNRRTNQLSTFSLFHACGRASNCQNDHQFRSTNQYMSCTSLVECQFHDSVGCTSPKVIYPCLLPVLHRSSPALDAPLFQFVLNNFSNI